MTATDTGTAIAGSTTLTVTPPVLTSIDVTPADPSIALGTNQPFTATGTFSDSSTQDITTSVTWSSTSPSVATVSNAAGTEGLATSVSEGATTITATDTGTAIAGSTTLTVTPPVLTSIDVIPADPSIALGTAQPFTATGTFSDSTTQDLTTSVTWSSTSESVATVSNAAGTEGLATSVSEGATTITATDSGTAIAGSTTLTVTPPVLTSIDVTPADPSIALGLTQPFTATGTYTDSSTQDLTSSATWSSTSPAVATVSNSAGTQGLATSVAVGATTITATDPATSVAGSTTLTVSPAVVTSIAVTPVSISVPVGASRQYTAIGTYSDSSMQDITASATWSSTSPAVATVSNAGGSEGLATGVSVGSTTVVATDVSSGVQGSAPLDVIQDITLRGASSAGSDSDLDLGVATPAGTVSGDVLVASIAVRPSTATITPPSGWTLVRRVDNTTGNSTSLALYTRVATAGEPASHTWSFSTSIGSAAGIAAFYGVDPRLPRRRGGRPEHAPCPSRTTPPA